MRHGAAQSGHKAKIEVAPGAKKGASRLFWGVGARLQFSLCAPFVLLRDATFLQMTRLLQVTKISKKKLALIPNRHHSTSFVKTSALGGFLASGTAVLTDFLKMTRLLQGTSTLCQAADQSKVWVVCGKLPWPFFGKIAKNMEKV